MWIFALKTHPSSPLAHKGRQRTPKGVIMEFSDIAKKLNVERTSATARPERHGFRRNKRGLMQKTLRTMLALRTANGIKPLGNGLICYADMDPREDRPEAELVRSHVWKQEKCGKLWAFVNGKTFPLAQITPTGPKNLSTGFVTQGGQFIIDG